MISQSYLLNADVFERCVTLSYDHFFKVFHSFWCTIKINLQEFRTFNLLLWTSHCKLMLLMRGWELRVGRNEIHALPCLKNKMKVVTIQKQRHCEDFGEKLVVSCFHKAALRKQIWNKYSSLQLYYQVMKQKFYPTEVNETQCLLRRKQINLKTCRVL